MSNTKGKQASGPSSGPEAASPATSQESAIAAPARPAGDDWREAVRELLTAYDALSAEVDEQRQLLHRVADTVAAAGPIVGELRAHALRSDCTEHQERHKAAFRALVDLVMAGTDAEAAGEDGA